MKNHDHLIVSMFGLDALALIGLLSLSAGAALAIWGAALWPAYVGIGLTTVALVSRYLVTRKLRPSLTAPRQPLRLR